MSEVRRAAVAEDGTLNYTSVSAVKKHITCPAAWYYRYKLRRPEPQGAGAKESDECHKRVEHYLKTGENVLGEIERRALKRGLFPAPGADLLIEASLDTLDAHGVPFVVKIDCIDPRRVVSEGLLVVNDWKFKKDVRKYGATAEQLSDPNDEESGLQMVGYGEAIRRAVARGMFPGTRIVRLRHVEVDKTKDHAEEVLIDVPVEKFEELWAQVVPNLPRMKKTALAADVVQVEGNKRACFKFGGCAFRSECPHYRSPAQADQMYRLKALFTPKHERSTLGEEEKTMGLLDRMRNAPAAVNTPAPPTQAAPTTAPAEVVKFEKPAPKSFIIDESTTPDEVLKAQRAETVAPVAQVLPPDAPKPTKPETVQAAAPAQVAETPTATPAETITPQSSEPKRRGRKPKEFITKAEGKPAGTDDEGNPLQTASASGFTLFIGCTPKSGAQSLSTYVNALERSALDGFKANFTIQTPQGPVPMDLDDIRFASGPEVGYGKWKAVLAKLAQATPPAPGKYTVLALGMDERVDAVVAALESLAVDVVTR